VLAYFITLVTMLMTLPRLEGKLRTNSLIFIIGWLIGGMALTSIALGDVFRIFDVLGQIFLSIASIILYLSFSQQLTRNRNSSSKEEISAISKS
ncbi:MAG: hypothetical protein ACFFBD_29975, partial [Candidatus Hodarchaeota archaeon]